MAVVDPQLWTRSTSTRCFRQNWSSACQNESGRRNSGSEMISSERVRWPERMYARHAAEMRPASSTPMTHG